ncbi:hypothetical protein NDU88_002759 [Pleurodeles waltl]|uniref:Uncharacterized protein n=1 Tax=Pleurodeles waltl TaxID=8319 RepID=A0AAV7SBH1_PLEWA|nr:hypothetical protein NDU88_002759 [Pleurodeles waltl]
MTLRMRGPGALTSVFAGVQCSTYPRAAFPYVNEAGFSEGVALALDLMREIREYHYPVVFYTEVAPLPRLSLDPQNKVSAPPRVSERSLKEWLGQDPMCMLQGEKGGLAFWSHISSEPSL